MSNNLARELLRWIQGLDLSYSVKNVKRDFANGFLVAEILSRYYGDVDMHSFSNGIGMTCRKDNWFQLNKLFRKWGLEVDAELVNEIIHAKTGSVNVLLEYLYTTLTDRKLSKAATPKKDAKIPAFARSTASNEIKQMLKRPDMINVLDLKAREQSIMSALGEHNSKVLEARKAHRKAVTDSMSSRSYIGDESTAVDNPTVSGAPSQVSKIGSLFEGVQVQQVQVRQLNNNVSDLRAKKQHGQASPLQLAGFQQPRTDKPQVSLIVEVMDKVVGDLFDDIESMSSFVAILERDMNQANMTKCGSSSYYNSIFSTSEEDCPEVFCSEMLTDVEAARVFEEIGIQFTDLDHAIKMHEFWNIINLFLTSLETIPVESQTFESCQEAFVQFGLLMLRQVDIHKILPHRSMVFDMLMDVAEARLMPIIKSNPAKRRAGLMIMGAFMDMDVESRTKMIKKLHESLNNVGAFLHSLTILIFMEQNLGVSGPGLALLDLYAYYTFIGISLSSPTLRAASLAMLAVILQHDPSAIPRVLPTLNNLVEDEWWEVQCQLLIVCSKMLDHLYDRSDFHEETEDYIAQTLDIINLVFRGDASINIQKVGLAYLGHHVGKDDQLLKTYIEILLSLTENFVRTKRNEFSMENLLAVKEDPEILSEEVPVPSACGGVYHLPMLCSVWDGLAIANELYNIIQEQQLQNLELWHLQIINALVYSIGYDESEEESKWREGKQSDQEVETLFSMFKDYVFVAMCDPHGYKVVLNSILPRWISASQLDVLHDLSFYGSLKLLFTYNDCGDKQQAAADLLMNFISLPGTTELISRICTENPELLQNEILCELERHT